MPGHKPVESHNNIIDLNWYVLAGIAAGTGFTYLTFALCKWRYKTMTAIVM